MTHTLFRLSIQRFFSLFQHMVQTGMTSPYPAFPQQNGGGGVGDPPLKPVSVVSGGDMKSDLVSPITGVGGGVPVVSTQQTNGIPQQIIPMANGEQQTQQIANPTVSEEVNGLKTFWVLF
jgi:hypothetical protein